MTSKCESKHCNVYWCTDDECLCFCKDCNDYEFMNKIRREERQRLKDWLNTNPTAIQNRHTWLYENIMKQLEGDDKE